MSMTQAGNPDQPYSIQSFTVDGDHVVIQYVDPSDVRRTHQKITVLAFDPVDCHPSIRTRVAELFIDLCALVDEVEGGGPDEPDVRE